MSVGGYQRLPVRECKKPRACQLCTQRIEMGDTFHDGGYGNCAHAACVTRLAGKIRQAPRTGVAMGDTDLMPFGVHKDKPMREVPAGYLDHIAGEPWIAKWPGVLGYIESRRKVLDKELEDET